MAAQTESTTPSVQVVGNAFVEQYYHILHHSPDMVHKFYQDLSFISRPDEDGAMITVTTMKGINDKICSLDYTAYKAEIKTADAQESYKDGVIVLVTGFLTRKEDNQRKKFIQSFFLAPQDKGYFVLNDVFRYVDESKPMEDNHVIAEEINDNQTPSLIPVDCPLPDPAGVHKEEAPPVEVEEESVDVSETEGPPANESDSVQPEPRSIESVIPIVEESVSSNPVEDAPKLSYASILNSQIKKGGLGPNKVYVPAKTVKATPAKTENRIVVTGAQGPPPEAPAPIASSSVSSPKSINAHDEGDGYSVYIRNLPHNATVPQLETEFKKFGPIKQGGIQVRSHKFGFCFGFVEFQDATSMQTAIQSSPVLIGGKEVVVEIKRTTTRVGIGRGRFSSGRGGFRSDGFRARGGSSNSGGGRGYGRTDYGGGRGDFSGRGRGPGGHGGDSYHQGRGRGGGRRGGSTHYTTATSSA